MLIKLQNTLSSKSFAEFTIEFQQYNALDGWFDGLVGSDTLITVFVGSDAESRLCLLSFSNDDVYNVLLDMESRGYTSAEIEISEVDSEVCITAR